MKRKYLLPIILSTCSTIMFSSETLAITPTFQNVSVAAGISQDATDNNNASGIGWIDFDNDGYQDLYVTNKNGPNRLYRNNGNGQFTEVGAAAGANLINQQSNGVAIGDYDSDGYDDIFVANTGPNTLLRNKGDGTFEDVSVISGLASEPLLDSYSASFGDMDGDGDLDLYVGTNDLGDLDGNGVCSPNEAYTNNGDGTFSRVPASVGIDDVGCTFANVLTDFDNDNDLDLLVVNDFFGTHPNQMYRNDTVPGSGQLTFTPVGDLGIGHQITGMGVAVGDYDNDGDLDYYRTIIGPGYLSTNQGDGSFVSTQIGAFFGSEGPFDGTGWGAAFFDADNDGDLDLYRGNDEFTGNGNNKYFQNNGDGTFTIMNTVGLLSTDAGLGLAIADYDNDGDMDVVVHGRYGQVNLFRNDTVSSDHWLKVNLKGNNPNHRGIGAKVKVVSFADDGTVRKQLREVHSGSSHGSTEDFRPHFGLGDHTAILNVKVTWPSGCVQKLTYGTVGVDQIIDVEEWACGLPNGVAGTINIDTGGVLEGALVKATDPWSLIVRGTDISDIGGHYDIPIDVCICNMTATKVGWDINWDDLGPGGQIWAWINNNLIFGDFTAVRTSGTLSGYALDINGVPVPGVGISGSDANGGNTFTATTDSNGRYEVAVSDATYWVQGGPGGGCSSFWPDGNNFFEWLVTVNFDDQNKDVVCVP